ncbi:MAG TPA: hypothetical protein VGP82_15885 [Ktedonobacterales bacterium]|nr:hypothetical protein [Ktedonobacterales bacterium]
MTSSMGQTSNVQQTQGQQATGMPNHLYDLVSILYHAMESAASNQTYIQDAQQAGDNDLLQFFQMVQQEDRQRVQRAQQLISQKLSSVQPSH